MCTSTSAVREERRPLCTSAPIGSGAGGVQTLLESVLALEQAALWHRTLPTRMSTYVQEFAMDEPRCMRLLRAVDGSPYSDAAIEGVASNNGTVHGVRTVSRETRMRTKGRSCLTLSRQRDGRDAYSLYAASPSVVGGHVRCSASVARIVAATVSAATAAGAEIAQRDHNVTLSSTTLNPGDSYAGYTECS